jgi:peptidylprolyl isomerase
MADSEKTEDVKADDGKGDDTKVTKPAPPAEPVRQSDPAQRNKLIGVIAAVALLAVIVVVVLIAQGGGDGEDGGDVSSDLNTKPVIEAREGEPPTELETTDIVTGDGAEATPGSQVSVEYVGALFDTGEEFDASWDRGEPFEFQLGSGQVIPGWDEGVAGMKVGGRRELVIPSDLAYGPAGSPPAIGPDEALVFVVDLVDVQPAPAGGAGAAGATP